MASPRFNGQGFTNPTNPLGFHSENRYRAEEPLGNQFMSDESRLFNATAALTTIVKVGAKELAEQAAKEAAEKGASEATQIAIKQAVEAAAEKAGMEAIQKAGKNATEEAIEQSAQNAMKIAAKEAAGGAAEQSAKELAEQSAKKLAQAAFLKKGAAIGIAICVMAGGYALVGSLGLKGVSETLDDFTGLNCDEKAVDAGLDESTEEYTEYVETCQKSAAKRMTILGITSVVVVGGVIWLLLK